MALGPADTGCFELNKLWVIILAGVAFGMQFTREKDWLRGRIKYIKGRFPVNHLRGSDTFGHIYGDLGCVEGDFWEEMDKQRDRYRF